MPPKPRAPTQSEPSALSVAVLVLLAIVVVCLLTLTATSIMRRPVQQAHSGTVSPKQAMQCPINPRAGVDGPAHVTRCSEMHATPDVSRGLDVNVRPATPPPPMGPCSVAAGAPFRQAGIVYSADGRSRYPLFSRPAPYHRGRMQYYISTGEAHIQVSPRVNGRDCGESIGCDELFDGDTIEAPELGEECLKVKLAPLS